MRPPLWKIPGLAVLFVLGSIVLLGVGFAYQTWQAILGAYAVFVGLGVWFGNWLLSFVKTPRDPWADR